MSCLYHSHRALIHWHYYCLHHYHWDRSFSRRCSSHKSECTFELWRYWFLFHLCIIYTQANSQMIFFHVWKIFVCWSIVWIWAACVCRVAQSMKGLTQEARGLVHIITEFLWYYPAPSPDNTDVLLCFE